MTPKEKAIELMDKMLIGFIDWTYSIPIDKNNNHTIFSEAKQRSIIAVDECIEFEKRIISQLDKITKDARGSFICESEYYLEVKNEINKL
jgi:hypothetical protein